MGLMQLDPANGTAIRRGRTRFDPQQNIEGRRQLSQAPVDLFGGDLNLSLAAYNAGGTRAALRRIPAIPETQKLRAQGHQHLSKLFLRWRRRQKPHPGAPKVLIHPAT